MPTVKVESACYQYGPGVTFRLGHDATSPSLANAATPEDFIPVLDVKITKPLQVGYGLNSQVVVADIQGGSGRICEKSVVLRIFDPLYVSPDLLEKILYIGEIMYSGFHLTDFW